MPQLKRASYSYLEADGLDLGVADEVPEALSAEVADAEVLDLPGLYHLLEGLPSLADGDGDELHLGVGRVGVVEPLGRVALLEGHEGERDGEVDVVEVEVVEAEVVQGALEGQGHVLGLVVGVPQLRGHMELFPRADALLDRLPDALSDLEVAQRSRS